MCVWLCMCVCVCPCNPKFGAWMSWFLSTSAMLCTSMAPLGARPSASCARGPRWSPWARSSAGSPPRWEILRPWGRWWYVSTCFNIWRRKKHRISGCFSWLHVFVWKCSRGCKRKMLCYCSNDCIMMICEYLYDVRVCVCVSVCLSIYLSIYLSVSLSVYVVSVGVNLRTKGRYPLLQ